MNTVSPTTFTDVIRALFWLVGACGAFVFLVNGVRQWFAKPVKGIPQPIQVEFQKEFVSVKQHDELKNEVHSNYKELDGRIDKVDADRRESVSRCYKNTERLVGEMRDEIKGTQKDLSKQIADNNTGLNGRINDLLGAVHELSGKFEQSQRK